MSGVIAIAVVGSGPSGFYAAEALLRSDRKLRVDLIERLPFPYGLVRYGVAPDHLKLKSVTAVFDRVAADPGLRFIGGVEIGRELSLDDLRAHYDAVVLACGTPASRRLDVPGEDLPGVFASSAFVGWYNGHPDHASCSDAGLVADTAVVVGHGNVALDVCRLLSKSAESLAASDLPEPMLAAFAESRVRTVHLLGRGTPGRARFTAKELRELGELPGVRVRFPQAASRVLAALETDGDHAALLPTWRALAACGERAGEREIHVWFGVAPERFIGDTRLRGVRLRATDRLFAQPPGVHEIDCGLAVSCIGYRGLAMAGVPFDAGTGTVPNAGGRVVDSCGVALPSLYVTGWLKRGPTGVIGTNRADSLETIAALLEDIAGREPKSGDDVVPLLEARGVRPVTFADWQRIDRHERDRARATAPREKVCSIDGAREFLGRAERS